MPFQPLRFKPGIVRETTHYANGGSEQPGWWNCDKMRFRFGLPETIGGWIRASLAQVYGTIRALFTWSLLSGDQPLAIGTEKTANILSATGQFDITPIAAAALPPDSLETLFGIVDTHVLVLQILPGAIHGESIVTIEDSGDAPGTGSPTEAQISSVWLLMAIEEVIRFFPGFDPVTNMAVNIFKPGVPAFRSDLLFGSATTAVRLYGGGGVTNENITTGWGGGGWGLGDWNASLAPSPVTQIASLPNTIVFDNFGQDLIFCWRNGPLYIWKPSYGFDLTGLGADGRAVLISSLVVPPAVASEIPSTAYEVMVSEQTRIVMAFATNTTSGDFDPMLVRWSDQENYLVWTPSPTNSAGELRLQSGSIFITAVKTRREILAWTDRSLNSIQFIGGELVFGIEVMARGISIAGPNAKIAVDDDVYWMGIDQFYHYSGSARTMPCSVQEYVFNNLNRKFAWRVCCAYEPAFNEIKWFYPSLLSEENDSYVSINRYDDSWSIGTMPRTAWTHRALKGLSAGASTDGYVYAHEVGFNDGSVSPPAALTPFITSSPIEVGQGDRFVTLWRMLPDITFRNSGNPNPTVNFIFQAINEPGRGVALTPQHTRLNAVTGDMASVAVVEKFTSITYFRLRSRMMRVTVTSNGLDTGWRMGVPRIDGRTDGQR